MATISRRGDRICVRVYAYYDPATRRKHEVSRTIPAASTPETIKQTIEALEDQARELRIDGTTSIGSLLRYYLESCEISGMAPTTLSAYRSFTEHHVLPRIGDVLIGEANAATFSRFFRDLQVSKSRGGAALQAQTVGQIYSMLSGCFNSLVRDGIIPRDPLVGVKPPRGTSPEASALNGADLAVLLHWLDKTLTQDVTCAAEFERRTFAAIVWLTVNTGLRRGEVAGLNVCNVITTADPMILRILRTRVEPRGRVVSKSPKSKSSRRSVVLDDRTAEIIRDYLLLRNNALPSLNVRASRAGEVPLFVHFDGRLWRPSQISARFRELVDQLGLDPSSHFHTLRHTHATYLIQSGENILTVQERLGHSSSRITLDFYGHLLPGRDEAAAATFGKIASSILGG